MSNPHTRPPMPRPNDEMLALLRQVSIFEALDEAARKRVLDAATSIRLKAGDWLFRAHGLGDTLYLVASGRLEVIGEHAGTPRLITVLGPGECVGELALLCDLPRSASVRARRDCELLEIGRETFEGVMADDPRLAVAMTRLLAQRLHRTSTNTGQTSRRRLRVLSLLPLHPGLPLHDVRTVFHQYFSQFGRTAVLTGDEIDVSAKTPEHAEVAYARLLDRTEGGHETVILVADPTPSAWNKFCQRQGDRHLVMAWTHAPIRLASEIHLDPEHCDLALFGPPPLRGSVMPWIEALAPRQHHHVYDSDRTAMLLRVARRIAGRSVGVVLSGGGARGFAHVGVLEGLVESGVQIDRIGGTSMGAMIAGLFAMGTPIGDLREIVVREIQSPFDDYTVPFLSLTRARKALRMVRRLFGDRLIEELPISMFSLSADLLTATPFIHRHGEMAEAVACSAALPGLAPPRRFAGRLLVDGALLNNLPTDIMAGFDEGPIIASDVMARRDEPSPDGLLPGVRPPPRWLQRFTQVLGNQPGPLPTIVQTLMRASVLGAVNAATAQRALADLVVMPEVSHIGLLEFNRGSELFRVGHEAALAVADEHGLVDNPDRWQG